MSDKIKEIRIEIESLPDSWFFKEKANYLLSELDAANQENESLRESLAEWQGDFQCLNQENERLKHDLEVQKRALESSVGTSVATFNENESLQQQLKQLEQENNRLSLQVDEGVAIVAEGLVIVEMQERKLKRVEIALEDILECSDIETAVQEIAKNTLSLLQAEAGNNENPDTAADPSGLG